MSLLRDLPWNIYQKVWHPLDASIRHQNYSQSGYVYIYIYLFEEQKETFKTNLFINNNRNNKFVALTGIGNGE